MRQPLNVPLLSVLQVIQVVKLKLESNYASVMVLCMAAWKAGLLGIAIIRLSLEIFPFPVSKTVFELLTIYKKSFFILF